MSLNIEDKNYIEGLFAKNRDYTPFSVLVNEIKNDQRLINQRITDNHEDIRIEISNIREIIQNTPLVNKITFSFIGLIVVGAVSGVFSLVWRKMVTFLN